MGGLAGEGKARGGRVVWELQGSGGVGVGDVCAPWQGRWGVTRTGRGRCRRAAAIEGLTLL